MTGAIYSLTADNYHYSVLQLWLLHLMESSATEVSTLPAKVVFRNNPSPH